MRASALVAPLRRPRPPGLEGMLEREAALVPARRVSGARALYGVPPRPLRGQDRNLSAAQPQQRAHQAASASPFAPVLREIGGVEAPLYPQRARRDASESHPPGA